MEVTSCLPPPLTVYNGRTQRLPQGGLNQGLIRDLGTLIRRIAAPEAPVRVPNAQECRFCDISVTEPRPSGRKGRLMDEELAIARHAAERPNRAENTSDVPE